MEVERPAKLDSKDRRDSYHNVARTVERETKQFIPKPWISESDNHEEGSCCLWVAPTIRTTDEKVTCIVYFTKAWGVLYEMERLSLPFDDINTLIEKLQSIRDNVEPLLTKANSYLDDKDRNEPFILD